MKYIVVLFSIYTAHTLVSCSNGANGRLNGDDSTVVETNFNDKSPLQSWNDGKTKTAIFEFVKAVVTKGSPNFVKKEDRIAVFDNDGTLWSEQPFYFQLFFVIDRVKALAPKHPEWTSKEPYKSILEGDVKKALASGEQGVAEMMMMTHAGTTDEEFSGIVREWMNTAQHPVTHKKYTEMVYQPMLELMQYLRAVGFQVFIVSGGGVDFMRPWTERVYGVPAQQVIGSSLKVKYEVVNDTPRILRLPEVNFIDDKAGKPAGIHQYIGKRPIFTAGNSDGDYEMLQWTSTGTGKRMGIIIHHTDSLREWSYDRGSPIGKLEKGLDDAAKYGWLLVDMKQDWKFIYPYDRK